jgi:lipopolysaccharide transport system ATP-binding protein
VKALNDVTLELQDHDRLGLIGHNGAGKSTLLRLLAGVYPPTAGTVQSEGRISSLFDVTTGFEPECSGWENMALRGYLQGETPATIAQKKQEIAEFSELGEHLEMPVRFYSMGMVVRLGIAIATAIEPEILIVDEILSAGDIGFQEKTRRRILDLVSSASLVVLASHDLASLQDICTRIVWMDHGQFRMVGDPQSVIAAYHRANDTAQKARAA